MPSFNDMLPAVVPGSAATVSHLATRCREERQRDGAPDTIRTCDLHLRRVALYPAELRVHLCYLRNAYADFSLEAVNSELVSL